MYLNFISNAQAQENSSPNAAPKTSPLTSRFILRQHGIFSKYSEFLEKVTFSSGDYLNQPETSIDYIYFPETAVVSEFQILKDGRAVGVSLYGSESIVGFSSIFGAQPSNNWTQVLLAGSGYKMKLEVLKDNLPLLQSIQALMFEYVDSHIKQLAQRVVCNSYHTVEERCCGLLLMLQHYRKSTVISITHEQIAYFLGTQRPSITQVAQALRARKTINYVRGKIIILDGAQLKESACDCYAAIES